ncbi:succinate-semialdehyde dehydrogenase/glutarate-semialdehyde dehydrogenase [Kitasatospora sp. GP30]|uniref:succinic semialdehyde dehydrogenase n=1 Tax=Kitasatospora sp. GP30 TaxID=3035084 RepID=UPI000C70BDF8|nr:succinic semialdehyde dehydrogenase [Kitasatospora sp. GP30]MDH6140807.1 succinate-semialdehyde dehydrogenase/glutarate-semialdehyde dehydrogenase [Kitasatospora sp. GP30]
MTDITAENSGAARNPVAPGAGRTVASAVPQSLVARLARGITAAEGAATEWTVAPLTGEPLAELPQSTVADVDTAYRLARGAQQVWAARPVRARAAVLLRFHDLLLKRQDEVLDLIQAETGKARLHAFEEVLATAMAARHYGRAAAGYLKDRRRGGAVPVLTHTVEGRRPKGVVGQISPWNYPLELSVSDALPAFVAGNAVVNKPDTQTALTALWARELLVEAGLPAELWQIVVGDGPVIGPAVVERADYVSFTGSTRTGREVAQRAAARLVGASLELGGKNAMLVLADADLDKAAEGAVRACFSSAGQLCISIERLFVHGSVADAFLERFAARTRALRLGGGLAYGADMGSLVSQRQLDTVTRHVEEAVKAGAAVLAGGQARPDIGPLFFEPTILDGVTDQMAVCAEETFGPVVSIYRFDTEDEAVATANATPYGLNSSVWTRDLRRGRAVAARLRTGTVNVNEAYAAAYGSVASPMGGMGDSGLGRRHGAEGILRYTEAQTIASQRVMPLAPAFGLDDEKFAALFTRSLRALKALGFK